MGAVRDRKGVLHSDCGNDPWENLLGKAPGSGRREETGTEGKD